MIRLAHLAYTASTSTAVLASDVFIRAPARAGRLLSEASKRQEFHVCQPSCAVDGGGPLCYLPAKSKGGNSCAVLLWPSPRGLPAGLSASCPQPRPRRSRRPRG